VRHRLASVDRENRTAVCSVCGPTRIYVRPDRPTVQCWSRREEGKRRAHLINPPRKTWLDRIKLKYGLGLDQWEQLLVDQSGRCDICEEPLLDPHVDHDHRSGKVRALLCRGCNVVLGLMADDPVRLANAAAYLTRHAA
jgi:hypothetical protein